MYRACLLIITACWCNCLFAQNLPLKFEGRWRTQLSNGHADDLLFISDSKGAVVTPDNRLCAYFNYRTRTGGKVINIDFSFDVDREKHPNYQKSEITFLNDSTFICHGTFITKFASYLTKNDRTYTKVKPDTHETDLRPVTYKDLKGRWTGNYFNNDDYETKKPADIKLFFVDDDTMIEMHGDSASNVKYKIDFTKQPSPMEFTYTSCSCTVQALLMFTGTDKMRIQWFPNHNRGDHFTDIGYSMWLLREGRSKNNNSIAPISARQ